MAILLLILIVALPSPEPSKSPREWLAHGQRALAEGRAADAVEAFRRAREEGLPLALTIVHEVRALVALKREADAVAALKEVPAPAGGVIATLGAYESLAGFRERSDVRAELERLRPCSSQRHREFDFWIGSWTVTDESGERKLGSSRVSRIHGGCVVLEEWTSAAGTTGSSLNLFDERSRKWHQFWADSSGSNWLSWDGEGNPSTIRGGMVDGEMIMVAAPGTTPMMRGRWKAMDDGRVRQIFESSADDGVTWTISFEGYYSAAAGN